MRRSTRTAPPVKNPAQVELGFDAAPAWSIYVLCDPRESDPVLRIRYVGVTSRTPEKRYVEHLQEAQKTRTHKANWIRALFAAKRRPVLEVLESGAAERICTEAEKKWIAYYRELGCQLTNLTDGGDMPPSQKGRKITPEHLRRLQAGRAAMSQEAKAAMNAKTSASLKGKRPSDANRQAVLASTRGRHHTEEAKVKISAANRGKVKEPLTDEQRERCSKTMKETWNKRRQNEERLNAYKASIVEGVRKSICRRRIAASSETM